MDKVNTKEFAERHVMVYDHHGEFLVYLHMAVYFKDAKRIGRPEHYLGPLSWMIAHRTKDRDVAERFRSDMVDIICQILQWAKPKFADGSLIDRPHPGLLKAAKEYNEWRKAKAKEAKALKGGLHVGKALQGRKKGGGPDKLQNR